MKAGIASGVAPVAGRRRQGIIGPATTMHPELP